MHYRCLKGGECVKIVIPVGDLHIGGGCKVLVDLSHALMNRGHDVEIVMPRSGTIKYDVRCKMTIIPSLSKEYIPKGDIILPNFYTTFIPAYEAWPKQCIRLSLGFEPYWVPNKELALSTYKQGVPIISISHWLDNQIYNHVGQRSTVVNLGVDPNVFFPTEKKRGIHSPKVILYIARNPKAGYALKGFDDFKDAMQIVKSRYQGNVIVHLICPGGPLSLPNVPHRIFTPKTEKEMANLYRTSDLFVSSSWFEAFSLPPLEAMACGTPVVTTNSGGVLDFSKHLTSAYITKPKHPKSIANGILAVLSDEKLADRLSKGGLKSAQRLTKQRFENAIVCTLESIYRDRLNGK